MKRILLVASDNNLGSGAFRSLAELSRLIKESGRYDPIVLIPKKGDGIRLLQRYAVEWIYVRSFSWVVKESEKHKIATGGMIFLKRVLNIIAIARIIWIIKKEKIDLVHNNTIWTYVGARAALKENIPLIWHIREGLDADQNKCLFSEKCYGLVNKADRLLFISNYLKDHYSERLKKEKALVIYNGINPEEYSADVRIGRKNEICFLNVGNMTANKGQEYIIAACSNLVKKGEKGFSVTFVGDGSKKEYLQELVKKNGCEKTITFSGFHRDVSPYYRKADVFIMSSDYEAFGRTTVEAMLSGCLVIGADSGATKEILADGAGVLFERGNSEMLSEIMADIIRHPGNYTDIAIRGQKSAKSKFGSEQNAKCVMNIYDEVLLNGGKQI